MYVAIPEEKGTKFLWTIEGIDMNPLPRGKYIQSPFFSADDLKTTKFSLFLYPRGHSGNEDDSFVSLYLKRHEDDGDDSVAAEYVMGLVDNWKVYTNVLKFECSFSKNSKIGYKKFCTRYLAKKSMYYVENRLTVFCGIYMKSEGKNPPSKICRTLSRDLGGLLATGLHSDMTILAGGERFNVHRVILESRCPSLMSHLELKGKEYFFQGDIEAESMRSVLCHLYSGTFSDSGMLETVLVAAQVYGLRELKRPQFFPKAREITAITRIIAFRVFFEMNIREIVYDSKTAESYLMASDEVPEFCWMKVSIAKERGDDDQRFRVSFRRLYDKAVTFIQCEVFYLSMGVKVKLLKCDHLFESEDSEWGTPMSVNSMPADILSKGLLRLDIRTSANEESCLKKIIVNAELRGSNFEYVDGSGIFQKDLRDLCANMKLADLTLCVDNALLPVHKAILCSRSQVFSKMFEHETLEKQTGVVKIEDVDLGTMKSVLKYMYCGDVDDNLDVPRAISLYMAAEKYELLELRGKCSKCLKSSICVESVGEVILLADLHHDKSLKKCAYEFVKSHTIEIIDSKTALAVLKDGHEDLYNEILDMFLKLLQF